MEGVFHSMVTSGPDVGQVVLKYAKVIRDTSALANDPNSAAQQPLPTCVIEGRDVVSILAKDVKLSPADLGPVDSFETDSAISRGRGG